MPNADKINLLLYLLTGLVLFALVIYDGLILKSPMYRVGDVIEHIAAINSWLVDLWSPGNPAVDSDTSSPRYIPVYFPIVVIGSILGWSGWMTYDVLCLFGIILFLWGIFRIGHRLHPHPFAPFILLVVMLVAWTNPWNYSSVYEFATLYRIAGYPSIITFGLSLIVLSVLMDIIKDQTFSRKRVVALIFGTALVISSHVLTGAFLILAAGVYIVFYRQISWAFRGKVLLLGVAGIGLSALWPYYPVLDVALGNGSVTKGSWITAMQVDTERTAYVLSRHPFYEIGRVLLIFPGFLAAIYCAARGRYVPLVGFLGFILIYFFNIYFRVPMGHRFIIYTFFFSHLAISILWLDVLTYMQSRGGKVLAVFFGSLLVLPSAYLFQKRTQKHMKPPNQEIVDRNLKVQTLTDKNSIIAGTPRSAWQMTAYDRKVVALLHPNPMIKDRGRRDLANAVLSFPDINDGIRQMAQNCYDVSHVLVWLGPKRRPDKNVEKLIGQMEGQAIEIIDIPGRHKLVVLSAATENKCPENASDLMWESYEAAVLANR